MPTAENDRRRNILRLRRRFLKDQEKTSLNYAQKEIQQQRIKKVCVNFGLREGPNHSNCLTIASIGAPSGRKSRAEAAKRGSSDSVPQLPSGRLPRHPDLLQQPHHSSASPGPGETTAAATLREGEKKGWRLEISLVFFHLFLQRDPILAKQLFSAVFSGVIREMDRVKPREESARIKEELRVRMNSFLSKSALCFPPFIACVQVRFWRR